ncbi:protein phosphatase 2C-like domain-containing protein 1 [Sphaerodactylus townsendi]|uniref:protein phosphatase 2C-like domain-containing protein 1 n=1 Tax=Sphaerodactylus townsendi TaxID=933632 RepID=UPI00202746BA|nr:protein phosphatase 2C-like domain-containing protein 1 [Sphaerodactylus townsendi]
MSKQSEKTDSKLYKSEEDSTKAFYIDFKKVGHLDITVLCSICHEAVHIRQLFHHKRAHQAQAVLGYRQPWTEILDLNKLALQQKKLILGMINTPKYTEKRAHKIGFSFEFLKESLKITPYFCIDSVGQSSVHTEEVRNPVIKAIAICQDRNTLWQANLEDTFVVLDNYGNRPGTCFFGLFDGSNGIYAAETTSMELPLLFLGQLSCIDSSYQLSDAEQQVLDSFHTVFRADYTLREKIFTAKPKQTKRFQPNDYKWIHKAYAKSFWRMDRLLRLGRNEVSRIRWSSCSATTCLVEKIISEKQHQQTQDGVETRQRISEKNERNIMKQEELPENASTAEEENTTAQQQEVPLVSNIEEQKETLEKINEEEKTNAENSKCFINNEVRLQEDCLTNSDNSTQSEKGSTGIMHIANIGNAHVVLCKNGESYWLTKEHSTYSTKERRRVFHRGGHISSNEPKGMVEGIIRTTRGLGSHGNPQLKKTFIPVPHTISIPVDDSCQFLILASNGLWEVLDKNEVVTLAIIMYSAFLEKYQYAQLQKSRMDKSSKQDKEEDCEEIYFSWYLNPDFLFSEGDLEEDNAEQNSTKIRSPIISDSVEVERIPSGFSAGSLKEQKLNSPPKKAAESCILNKDTPFSEYTETTSSHSGSQTSFEELQVLDAHQVSDTVESTNNQASSPQTEDEETDATTFYAHAAKYISKHLVKAALQAGSRDNITVLVTLLNGCDKIPTYLQYAYEGSHYEL